MFVISAFSQSGSHIVFVLTAELFCPQVSIGNIQEVEVMLVANTIIESILINSEYTCTIVLITTVEPA